MGITAFDVGDLLRVGNQAGTNADDTVRAAFTNLLGVATDPTTVTLQLRKQSGDTLTYNWPLQGAGDDVLTKEATGRFYFDVQADEPGLWSWRLEGDGAVTTAQEGAFYVRVSAFV